MRWFVLCAAVWMVSAEAQTYLPSEIFDFAQSRSQRPDIAIVPIIAVDAMAMREIFESKGREGLDAEYRSVYAQLWPQLTAMFSTVRDSMLVLGVQPTQYNLYLDNHVVVIQCTNATIHSEQQCNHGDTGAIDDLPNFVHDLYDRETPSQGTVQLHILILQDGVSWKGTLGLAWHWWWVQDRSAWHWTNRACRAWALHSSPVVAHELGHCFGLEHNEENADATLDLMLSYYTHFDWVKDSNQVIVQQHFRYPIPESAPPTVQPQFELHY